MIIELNLMGLQDQLQVKHENGQQLIFDPIRHKWLVLQPEELVRQLLLQYLILEKGYNKNRISIEKLLKVNNIKKRFDILIYDSDNQPFILVECKEPHVNITDDIISAAFWQVKWYNHSLKAQYLLVTNGIKTYCCRVNYEQQSLEFLTEVPDPI